MNFIYLLRVRLAAKSNGSRSQPPLSPPTYAMISVWLKKKDKVKKISNYELIAQDMAKNNGTVIHSVLRTKNFMDVEIHSAKTVPNLLKQLLKTKELRKMSVQKNLFNITWKRNIKIYQLLKSSQSKKWVLQESHVQQ